MIVNQWVPAAHRADATGDSARGMRDMLRRMGHTADVYAAVIEDGLGDDVRPLADPASRAGDITIFHFALSSPVTEQFIRLDRGAKILQYHNVTPARFFAPFAPEVWRLARTSRTELASLVGHVNAAMGASEYNRSELEALGFANTGVLPLPVSVDRITKAPRLPALEALLDDNLHNFLFVGRIVPNKKVEDIIRLGEYYRRYVGLDYRFLFVGRYRDIPVYYDALRALIAAYRMPREKFVFTGAVTDDELAAYYRSARVYISMSEHEGFGVPLLEAMAADVPVLAYSCAAIPELLGGAGVQFCPKQLDLVAELLGVLARDTEVRARVLAGQRARLAYFLGNGTETQLRTLIARWASPLSS